jgi:hypothetical protein
MLNFILAGIAILLGAQMWRMGGDGNKAMRTFWLPVLLALTKAILMLPVLPMALFALVYAPLLMVAIALFSYGLKSPIHILWVLIFKNGCTGDYPPVEVATRATCGFLWSLAAIPWAMQVYYGWYFFAAYSIFLTVANGLIGPFVKNVEVSERAVGAAVSCSVLI